MSKKKSVKKNEGYQESTAHDQRLISKQQISSFLGSQKVPLGWLEIIQKELLLKQNLIRTCIVE